MEAHRDDHRWQEPQHRKGRPHAAGFLRLVPGLGDAHLQEARAARQLRGAVQRAIPDDAECGAEAGTEGDFVISFLQLFYFSFSFLPTRLRFSLFRSAFPGRMGGWGDGGEESLALGVWLSRRHITHNTTSYHDMGRFWSRSFRESVDMAWLMKT